MTIVHLKYEDYINIIKFLFYTYNVAYMFCRWVNWWCWGRKIVRRVQPGCAQCRTVSAKLSALASSCFTAVGLLPLGAAADQLPSTWREAFTGADVARNVWLLYSGVTLAPTSNIFGDGVRFRAVGGYGQYRYQGHRAGDPKGTQRKFEGDISYLDLLIGYQKRFGELTAKAFVGIAAIDHVISPDDPIAAGGLLTQGLDYGIKGALELWLNLGSQAWTSLDASWTNAHQTYAGRWRLGYRVLPTISLGLETAINGNALSGQRVLEDGSLRESLRPQSRAGLFARYEWHSGEISVSGGVANNAYDFGKTDGFDEFYGTANWLMRF